MTSFLHRIAQIFYTEYQQDITDFTFVFPNRRAGLFFQKYLTQLINEPIFSPDIKTINELFFSISELKVADRTDLLFRLHRIFNQISKRDESFDTFIGWGEMLLSDFDDVNKYLVDAKQIFTNVTELKEIDRLFNPFSDKQIEALKQFWEHFVPVTEGKTQEDFIAIWRVLLPIYEQFKYELLTENLATEAMIFRSIAENISDEKIYSAFLEKKYVFIGFNALNPCEKALFVHLQKNNQADFYWDYESDELQDSDNLSSAYFRENTLRFPSKIKIKKSHNSLNDKTFEIIAIPSAVGQSKEAFRLLNNLFPSESENKNWIETAVVLPDENLLLPMLYSLPTQIEKVNVTMGFPLKSTPVSGLMEHIFDLQKRLRKTAEGSTFYFQTVKSILHHPYIQLLCKADADAISEKIIRENKIFSERELFAHNSLLNELFVPCEDAIQFLEYLTNLVKKIYHSVQNVSEKKNQYRLESSFLYQYYITLNRLRDVMKKTPAETEFSLDTMIRIIRQLTSGLSIPFKGEPLDGLQIMGMLETRGLDFENLIICSFNEGIFPKRTFSTSFIPYNLRKAFELPTSENQDAIAAYNFYRLIQRAQRVFFLYDARTEAGQTGEMSRFAFQLQYHYGVKINVKNLVYDIRFSEKKPIEITKTPDIQEKLQKFITGKEDAKAFSASSLNNYIDCPLKFYFSQVERVEEPDEVEENIEANMFGTLLHKVMQDIYVPYEGKLVSSNILDDVLKNPLHIDKLIRTAFAEKYFKKKNTDIPLEGKYLIIGKVIEKYVRRLITFDKTKTPFTYIKSEEVVNSSLAIFDGKFSVNLKGIIDRAEEKEGTIRLIDYKSGAGNMNFKDLEEVFEQNDEKRPKYILQTFLYSTLYRQNAKDKVIIPQIYYVKNIFRDDFKTDIIQKPERNISLQVEDFAEYEAEFNERLTILIEEIYNPDIPFTQCEGVEPCKYCAFNVICRKQ